MSSTFAVGGLASGLDTKAIIEQLMSIERRPLSMIQGKQTAHGSRMAAMQSLKDMIASLGSNTKGLTDRAKVNAKSATTDTPSSSPAVLTASASADAINGSFKVTVKELATSTRVRSDGPVGATIDANAPLASAGFRYAVTYGTFRINNTAITVDENTTLTSLVSAINTSGAGVAASLVADADGRANNRLQLVAQPGHALQLGSLSDTSNALRFLNLSDAVIAGDTVVSSTNLGVTSVGSALANARLLTPISATAATVTGSPASAGLLSTSVTINGVTTNVDQTDPDATTVENAQLIAQAINDNPANDSVTATADADTGAITLTQRTVGATPSIDVTDAGTGTGLSVGTTQNGTNLTNGIGKFKINGAEITYRMTDSITTVINRINASSAGVTAFYDPVQDRLRLTASQTGARTMTLEDTQGNFLVATGLRDATQDLGNNARFSIDEVNGGADLTSPTNSISGYLPGVTLSLKSVSATPVTVTVSQNSQSSTNTVKEFVTQFNNVLQKIEDLTKYDLANKKASIFTGESGIRNIQRQLRQLVGSTAIGAVGTYRDLTSIGVSFGAVGSAAASTNRLIVDEAKLSRAVADNPMAVESLLASFGATLGTPTGTTVTGASGTPQIHQDGTYHVKITDGALGKYEAKFVSTSGQTLWKDTGTVTASSDSFAVIPGLKVSIGTLTTGAESTFSVSVTNRGIGVVLNDYLSELTGRDGYFGDRKASDDKIAQGFTNRLSVIQDRLDRRQAALEKKYTALEVAMSKLQNQGNALASQLSKLNASAS